MRGQHESRLCLGDSEWVVLSEEELVLGMGGGEHELSWAGFLANAHISGLPFLCQAEFWIVRYLYVFAAVVDFCFGFFWGGGAWLSSHYIAKADLKLIILLPLLLCARLQVCGTTTSICVCNSESWLWFSLHSSSIAQLLIPWGVCSIVPAKGFHRTFFSSCKPQPRFKTALSDSIDFLPSQHFPLRDDEFLDTCCCVFWLPISLDLQVTGSHHCGTCDEKSHENVFNMDGLGYTKHTLLSVCWWNGRCLIEGWV